MPSEMAALFCNLDQILNDVNVIVMIDDNSKPWMILFYNIFYGMKSIFNPNRINIQH